MAHEITKTDNVVLAGQSAWHGLGTVVEQAPTVAEALKLARLDWTVEQTAGVSGVMDTPAGPVKLITDTHVMNVRSDTKEILGVVGSGYTPVQNQELAEFVEALAPAGDVCRVESAGSIRGGKRVWFLVRGESFSVGKWGKDEVHRYLLVANGHDGSLALTAQPTSIRVVCSNTLHYSLGGKREQALRVRFLHRGDMASKIEEAKRTLELFQASGEHFASQAKSLSAKSMTREELQRFWLDVYTSVEGAIPADPKNAAESMQANRAKAALASFADTFDNELRVAGATAWNAMNAVTHWYDHQKASRSDDRTFSNLWGTSAARKSQVFQKALALV